MSYKIQVIITESVIISYSKLSNFLKCKRFLFWIIQFRITSKANYIFKLLTFPENLLSVALGLVLSLLTDIAFYKGKDKPLDSSKYTYKCIYII